MSLYLVCFQWVWLSGVSPFSFLLNPLPTLVNHSESHASLLTQMWKYSKASKDHPHPSKGYTGSPPESPQWSAGLSSHCTEAETGVQSSKPAGTTVTACLKKGPRGRGGKCRLCGSVAQRLPSIHKALVLSPELHKPGMC